MRQTWNSADQAAPPSDDTDLVDESHLACQRVDVPQATLARTLPL